MATVPAFLRPSAGRSLSGSSLATSLFPAAQTSHTLAFSTTASRRQRNTRDRNKKRGVSSLYRSGPRENNSMTGIDLPKPKSAFPRYKTDPNHGLWGFFPKPFQLVAKPEDTEKHGRAWALEELRKKSWEDLHALWWVCVKERNMLSTSKRAFVTGDFGFGEAEVNARDNEVKKTMRGIKHCLTERQYLWNDAVAAARDDPEIDLKAKDGEEAYKPSTFEEAYEPQLELEEEKEEARAANRRGKPDAL